MNRFRWLPTALLILLIVSLPLELLAGTGKISGRVIDVNKEGVIGAAIMIVETNQGSVADIEGFYTILNVQPGTYTVRVSSVGYGKQVFNGVTVNGDLTTTLNATLQDEAIVTEEQVIIYQAPTVKVDVPQKEVRFDKEDFQTRGVTSITSLLTKQPGFKVDQEGAIHVRGGREHEVLVAVDGQAYRDPLVNSSKRLVNFSALNVEEVEVLTGGDARYGGFQAALINVTTPEGDMKKFAGTAEWRTDRAFQTYSFNTDQYDYSLSGPVPFADKLLGPNKLSFFASGTSKLTNTYTPYSLNREANDYLGLGLDVPERQSNDYSAFLKMTYRLSGNKKLNVSYNRDYSLWDIYPDGEAALGGNYGWGYKYNVVNRPYAKNSRQSVNVAFSHNISKKTFYEVTFGNFRTTTQIRPRGKNPDEFTLADSVEDLSVLDGQVIGDGDNNGFLDGYIDANRNGRFDGEGEGYEDNNLNGQWDRGEDWVDLNGNGQFDDAEPWTDRANPQGLNNLGVWDPWDPFVDLNGNGRWDPAEPQLPEQDWNKNGVWDGERFIDANGDQKYTGSSEGYDDKNRNGEIDRKDLYAMSQDDPDIAEPYVDGDYWFDTGEPFQDTPDDFGYYNGIRDDDEYYWDLPSSYNGIGAPRILASSNNRYDGPNNAFDEYELFTYFAAQGVPESRHAGVVIPAEGFGADPVFPVRYTWGVLRRGVEADTTWINEGLVEGTNYPGYRRMWTGYSTWTNATLDDQADPVADFPDFRWNSPDNPTDTPFDFTRSGAEEAFEDYNGNGIADQFADNFLNPGLWDATAFWQNREATEWSGKMDLTSQVNKFHELKSGIEVKFRELDMQSISGPDQLYDNPDVPLPEGSPYPGRGATRDFYTQKPTEGAVYFQDKMEFEGMIVRAGLRSDFIIQSDEFLQATQDVVDADQPGALLAKRGRFVIAPRLGISHPVSTKSKLYFNYGHYYQAPSFEYFYRSATVNISPNTQIGNPNLEYEKTVSYELGVNTEFTEDWVVDVAGYYRDVYNQIGTVEQRVGPVTLNRYFNLGYGRARGFEFSLKRELAANWALTANYDYSYAYGKESAATEGLRQRQNSKVENRDEHPLGWDETHRVSAFLTLLIPEQQKSQLFGVRLPSDWLATVEYSYGSGLPYTPSTYTTGKSANLILANSARYPMTTTTDLKFDKYWRVFKNLKLTTGVEIYNLFNRKNVRELYAETGNADDASHEENPDAREDDNEGKDVDHNPRNYSAPRQIMLHFRLSF